MTTLAVIYHSRSGNTHQLAAAAQRAGQEAGAEVRLRKVADIPETMIADPEAHRRLADETADVPEATLDDLAWADAIMVGTPVHFGLPAPQIVNFIDHSGPIAIPGGLVNKAVTAFASGSMPHSGQQATILALHNAMCHWGSVIVPTGSSAEAMFRPGNGAPYGTATVSRHEPRNVADDNIEAIEFQTRRVLEVAEAVRPLHTTSTISYVDPEVLRGFGMDNLEWAWGWRREPAGAQ